MKKIWLLVLSLGLVGVAVYVVMNYLFYDFSTRNIVPAIKFLGKDIKNYLPQNYQINYPLSVPRGFTIDVFADLGPNLPRVLAFDSGGTLVVSSTRKGKVLALPDKDGDGKVDEIVEILSSLNKPHGIAFDENMIYVAETNKVSRYSYNTRDYTVGLQEVLFELPGGGRHFTRTIRVHDGKLFVSVGSSCDACIESDWRRASILTSNLDGTDLRVFAKGLRNTVFFAFDESGNMWGTEMGRDNLGDDLPPDEINIIREGKDYGWPFCYGNRVRDQEFKSGEEVSYCSDTEPSIYDLQAHSAPLGLAFIKSDAFIASRNGNLLVALHGSWNRDEPVGYSLAELKVFADTITSGNDYLHGWLRDSEVFGRPVDLVFSRYGDLYISDDYAGVVYIYESGS